MNRKRRDAEDLAARIEQGLNRGLDVVDAFFAVAGGRRSASRAFAREQRRALESQQRILIRHERQTHRWRRSITTGSVIAGGAGSIGALDLAVEAGGGGGAFGPPFVWFGLAAIGGVLAWRAHRKLRSAGEPPATMPVIAPPVSLPRSAIGATEVERLISVRMQTLQMAVTVKPLSPDAADELRRADAEAAGPLTALAERLSLLHQLQSELPNSAAARAAQTSAIIVQERLANGCETYEELLAASARLLAAPDSQRSTATILEPAVAAMVAYAHGLQKAYETFE